MSTNPALALSTSKNASASFQAASPSHSQGSSSPAVESHIQRRTGGSGSFGAGSQTRSTSTPRNNQPLRKYPKGQRRPKLADEDAAAESVSASLDCGSNYARMKSSANQGRLPCNQQVVERGVPRSHILLTSAFHPVHSTVLNIISDAMSGVTPLGALGLVTMRRTRSGNIVLHSVSKASRQSDEIKVHSRQLPLHCQTFR